MIGGAEPCPIFRFKQKMYTFTMQALAGQFKTKTNLTVSATASQIKGAAAPYGWALAWSIGDLPFNFATLFDQFRIRKIVCRISASENTNTTGIGALNYIVVDYDNSNLLTGVPQAQTYSNMQRIRGSDAGDGESVVITITPCIPITSLAGNEIKPCPWQDLVVTTNTHYGIKGWYNTLATTDPVWDVDAQYIIDVMNTQ